MVYRYNNYITKKIPYIRMLIKIKIVELFKQLLFIVYRGGKKKLSISQRQQLNQ